MACFFCNTAHLCNISQYLNEILQYIAIHRNIVFTRDTHPYLKKRENWYPTKIKPSTVIDARQVYSDY